MAIAVVLRFGAVDQYHLYAQPVNRVHIAAGWLKSALFKLKVNM
jgi:hypothetical protein